MQNITQEYENSQDSVLDIPNHFYELFYLNITEVSLLDQILTERANNNAYYPTLYRDIWFMLEQNYHHVQFNQKVDFSNDILSKILCEVFEHPTFHIIHDLTNETDGNSLISSLFVTEMISEMIDSTIEHAFNSTERKKDVDLSTYIKSELHIGNCLECAAQSILYCTKELPIFFDMTSFKRLPLIEKTNSSLQLLADTHIKEELDAYKNIYFNM